MTSMIEKVAETVEEKRRAERIMAPIGAAGLGAIYSSGRISDSLSDMKRYKGWMQGHKQAIRDTGHRYNKWRKIYDTGNAGNTWIAGDPRQYAAAKMKGETIAAGVYGKGYQHTRDAYLNTKKDLRGNLARGVAISAGAAGTVALAQHLMDKRRRKLRGSETI